MATTYENLTMAIDSAASVSVPISFKSPIVHKEIKTPSQIGKILITLKSGSHIDRLKAAESLGETTFNGGGGLPEAVTPLIAALGNDPDISVRGEAAWSLWKLGDTRAHGPLIKTLKEDPSAAVREKAARALGLLGAKEATKDLIELLHLQRHIPAKLRAGIAAALGYLASQEALPILLQCTKDVEPFVRYESVYALGRFLVGFENKITEKVFRLLVKHSKPRHESQGAVRCAAIKALRFSSDKRAFEAIVKILKSDPDSNVRKVATETIVLWNSASSEKHLIKALEDDNWDVRKTAARSISDSIKNKHHIYNSSAVCEAIDRMKRMFSKFSREGRLIEDTANFLKNSFQIR